MQFMEQNVHMYKVYVPRTVTAATAHNTTILSAMIFFDMDIHDFKLFKLWTLISFENFKVWR